MKVLDLFSGIGGISLAAEWAGMETVAFCEIEPYCQKVLQKHWKDVPIFDDVRKLIRESLEERGVDVGAIKLISAGYPCQPFSVAGKREGERDDRHLWPEVYRLLKEINPTWFLGENVAGHVSLGLDRVLSDLDNIGYACQPFIIPACAVNAPHERERVFIVAYTDSKLLPKGEESRNIKGKGTEAYKFIGGYGDVLCNTNGKPELQANTSIVPFGRKREARENSTGKYWRITPGEYWEISQPPVCGVANGFPDRVERTRALGNAVVPQQIYPILKAIVEVSQQ